MSELKRLPLNRETCKVCGFRKNKKCDPETATECLFTGNKIAEEHSTPDRLLSKEVNKIIQSDRGLAFLQFGKYEPFIVFKTATRRDWQDKYAVTFHKGDYCQAWSASPRLFGKKVGIIELTNEPYKEWSADVDDWRNEGFEYLIRNVKEGVSPFDIIRDWKENPRMLWVIRFKLINLEPNYLLNYHSPLLWNPQTSFSKTKT